MRPELSRLVPLLAHATALGTLAIVGGGRLGGVVVALLVVAQGLEARAAPDRVDTADAWAIATGGVVLGVVVVSLLTPGAGHLVGVGLGATGVGLRLWAIRTLGPWFLDGVVRLPQQPRLRHGPYRWLHHPAALGTVLLALGVAVVAGSVWGAGLVLAVLGPLQWARARAEDRLWSEAVGHRPTSEAG
ncbi:MAG: PEMT/PEM2 methyltransferase family protein [Myxococcota bacterium]